MLKLHHREKNQIQIFLKELKTYLSFLINFEAQITSKSHISKEKLQQAFNKAQERIINAAFSIEKIVSSRFLKRQLRVFFRNTVGHFIFQSKITHHAYLKPRGYPGDFFIFEAVYDNKPLSRDLGYYLDNWALEHFLTIGINRRKDTMKSYLKAYIQNSPNQKIRILNIGCGSCREIRELFSEDKNILKKNIIFACFDQDELALRYAKDFLKPIPNNTKFIFLKKDIFSIIGLKKSKLKLGQADLIYALGVADYFLKNMLEKFIKFCYSHLKPHGTLVIPFCSSHDQKLYTHLHWFCEWDFFTHNATQLRKFIKKEVGIKDVKIIWKRPNPVFFIIIEKDGYIKDY